MAFESIADKKIRSLLTMLGIIIGVGAVLILVSVVQGYNADLTAYYEKQGVNKVNVTLLNFDRTNTTDQSGEFMDWVNGNLSDYITGVTPSYSTSGTLRFETSLNETAVIKNSMSVMITMFASWAVLAAPVILYVIALDGVLTVTVYMYICAALLAAACAAMYIYLGRSGAARFAAL